MPSRLHPGKFYALPQAPQQFKQLIMVAGFDRYFQIAPCFRDEDARADRSPGEFYQLDLEMSFVTQDDVFAAVEPVLHGVFSEFADGRDCGPANFPHITYEDSMLKYGNDKRICAIRSSSPTSATCSRAMTSSSRRSRARPCAPFPRRAPAHSHAPGSTKPTAGRRARWAPPVSATSCLKARAAKGLSPSSCRSLRCRHWSRNAASSPAMPCSSSADAKKERAAILAGHTRTRLGRDLGLIDDKEFRFCWIVDFPMYEWNEDEKRIDFSHNPFSMPQFSREKFLALDKADKDTILGLKAYQYDIVCNGIELSSGAIRNHDPEVMLKAFEIAGYAREETEVKFAGRLNAFRYGAPPHGGTAPGIDRIVMLIAGEENLREVTMFPMNQQGPGPDDERARRSDAEAAQGASYPHGAGGEGLRAWSGVARR